MVEAFAHLVRSGKVLYIGITDMPSGSSPLAVVVFKVGEAGPGEAEPLAALALGCWRPRCREQVTFPARRRSRHGACALCMSRIGRRESGRAISRR